MREGDKEGWREGERMGGGKKKDKGAHLFSSTGTTTDFMSPRKEAADSHTHATDTHTHTHSRELKNLHIRGVFKNKHTMTSF